MGERSAPVKKRRLTKAGVRKFAAEAMQQRQVEPDARAKFAILQTKRREAEAAGKKFENRLDENGEWV